MKRAVNLILGVGRQAIAEAVAFVHKAGLERDRLLDVLSQTAVILPALVGKLKRAMLNDFSPQFPLRLLNKDFPLILETAAILGAFARHRRRISDQRRRIRERNR
jgi:3-hydroxyisobutyrate dehydrogenase